MLEVIFRALNEPPLPGRLIYAQIFLGTKEANTLILVSYVQVNEIKEETNGMNYEVGYFGDERLKKRCITI